MSDTLTVLRPSSSQRGNITASGLPPVMITACANAIKASGASICLLQKFDFGIQIRAEFGSTQIRIVVPPPSGNQAEVPEERNSQLFIARDVPSLKTWLSALT